MLLHFLLLTAWDEKGHSHLGGHTLESKAPSDLVPRKTYTNLATTAWDARLGQGEE